MYFMKNVITIVELRRQIKSLTFTVILLIAGIAGSAFTSIAIDPVKKPVADDSTRIDKNGFKSLSAASYFNPANPYATQLNPKAIPFVQNYIETEGAELERMKIWGKPYFDMFDGIFTHYGLPKELKYLCVIESSLVANRVSTAGAAGPWQIMPKVARHMGLIINRRTDQRKNFTKSTHAAAKILKELYRQFDDWLLVIAAYNCGAGRLRQAIKKSGSSDFWDLQAYLPAETRAHVKRFIGSHYIFEGSGGLTTMTAAEILDYHQSAPTGLPDFVDGGTHALVEVSGKYTSTVIAKNLEINVSVFRKLNPDFDKLVAMGQTYHMKLPAEKISLFGSKRKVILNESVESLLN